MIQTDWNIGLLKRKQAYFDCGGQLRSQIPLVISHGPARLSATNSVDFPVIITGRMQRADESRTKVRTLSRWG